LGASPSFRPSHSIDEGWLLAGDTLTRAGRPFEPIAELALEPNLIRAAQDLVPTDGSTVFFREFQLPAGVPDMLAVTIKPGALRRRTEIGVPAITVPQELRILSATNSRSPTSLAQLMTISGVAEAQTRRTISTLVAKGALTVRGANYYRSIGLAPCVSVLAFEAKVSDWRAGIAQALRYGSYAARSTAVLGEISPRVLRSARAAAKATGIGLHTNGRWIIRPRPTRWESNNRLATSELIFQAFTAPEFSNIPGWASGGPDSLRGAVRPQPLV
jgi:hypothetical protein